MQQEFWDWELNHHDSSHHLNTVIATNYTFITNIKNLIA